MATLVRKPIDISNLNFDELKEALIQKYKAEGSPFKDYDFEGSGLNILADILTYTLHMTSFLANMAGNEMFIDSAQLRESVVSVAKELGYTPRSIRAAKAHIDITSLKRTHVDTSSPIIMPAGTRFGAPGGLIFSTKEDYSLARVVEGTTDPAVDDQYEGFNIEIFEGTFTEYTYTVDLNNPDQKFVVPNLGADTSTLKVLVHEVATDLWYEYALCQDVTRLSETSRQFFLHQRMDGFYELTFGDGVIGRKLEQSDRVKMTYIVTSGKYNNVASFTKMFQIGGSGVYTITTQIKSYGASVEESIDSIRHAAPKNFEAQNRAVVVDDYETLLMNQYAFIDSLNIWGGQDNDPPQYGKVFIAIKATHVDVLSEALKAQIKENLIKNYNTVTVIPEILDPDFVYVRLIGQVYYDPINKTLSDQALTSLVDATMVNYFATTVERFGRPFLYSPLLTSIDDCERSVSNSVFDVYLQKRFTPRVQTQFYKELRFGNAIKAGTVSSSYYNMLGISLKTGTAQVSQIIDDGLGTLKVINPNTKSEIHKNIGTVDYTTGTMKFTVYVTDVPTDTLDIRIDASPVDRNVVPKFNQIVMLDNTTAAPSLNRQPSRLIEIKSVNTLR